MKVETAVLANHQPAEPDPASGRREVKPLLVATTGGVANYEDLRGGRSSDVLRAWRQRALSTFGRRVEWDEDGALKSGVVRSVDEEGGLVVETDTGSARIVSGELRWT